MSRADADGHTDAAASYPGAGAGTSNVDVPSNSPQLTSVSMGMEDLPEAGQQPQTLNSTDQAAISALDKINPTSIKESAEYSANIYGSKDGTVSTTEPARYPSDSAAQQGSPGADPSAIPKGTTYLGDLHTHGNGHVVINGREAQTDPEHFSVDDKKGSWVAVTHATIP